MQSCKKWKKNFRDMKDNNKWSTMCVIWILHRENTAEELFKETMAEIFSKSMKDIDPQI